MSPSFVWYINWVIHVPPHVNHCMTSILLHLCELTCVFCCPPTAVGQAPLATVLVGHPTRVQASIPLWHLLYMDLTASIQYDCMHTFSGNVKDIFLMLCGYLPKPDSLIPQYEIQINKRWLQGENHTRLREL